MTDTISIKVPNARQWGDRILMESSFCEDEIKDASGRSVVYIGTGHKCRLANSQDAPTTRIRMGVIAWGYGDIPAMRPFWVITFGAGIARSPAEAWGEATEFLCPSPSGEPSSSPNSTTP